MLGLVGGSDSVELKATVPDSDRRSTVDRLLQDAMDKWHGAVSAG